MYLRFSAALFCSLTASAVSFAVSAPVSTASSAPSSAFVTASRHLPATTPLAKIELYSMSVPATSAILARDALGIEIERLYTYAKTLPSGHERRTFETRIYLFEKRLRPLVGAFDVDAWEALRADVRAEWVAIQTAGTKPAALAIAN